MRLPLIGGAYSARSVIASCTRAVNLYPEVNPKTALVPQTHYQRPGLRVLAQGVGGNQGATVRGLWGRTDGNGGYTVIGQNVYYIQPNFNLTLLGNLTLPGLGPVSIIDNGTYALIGDGTNLGYQIQLSTNAFSQILDPTGSFNGTTGWDQLDTYTLWGMIGSNFFGSTLAGSTTFDNLYFAAKAAYPDPLVRLIVNQRQILLLGSKRSEIWYNAGGATFPFALLPGAYIQHGCVAPASVAGQDIEVYWLSQNEQGQGVVLAKRGYGARRISNHALEYQIRQMAAQGTIADAIGYVHQFDGHIFYVLTFPTGNQTWVYDASVENVQEAWHQRAWTDANGNLNRVRDNCGAFINGQFVVGDWQNGTLYALDPNHYTDDVSGVTGQITYIRTFHHIGAGRAQGTPQLVENDGKRMKFNRFFADLECGNGPMQTNNLPPQVSLRWSNTRGKTWRNAVMQSMGAVGNYEVQPEWQGLEIARDRIFELSYTAGAQAALNGAWIDVEVLDS